MALYEERLISRHTKPMDPSTAGHLGIPAQASLLWTERRTTSELGFMLHCQEIINPSPRDDDLGVMEGDVSATATTPSGKALRRLVILLPLSDTHPASELDNNPVSSPQRCYGKYVAFCIRSFRGTRSVQLRHLCVEMLRTSGFPRLMLQGRGKSWRCLWDVTCEKSIVHLSLSDAASAWVQVVKP
jgi:hypothetical protein